jgi:hypothetical protein
VPRVRSDMVVSYVRDLLETLTGSRPVPDQDGDLPVTFGGAQFYVRVIGDGQPVVQVFSVAVAELAASADLHTALNDMNTQLRFARTFHVADQVLVEHDIWGEDVNPANFRHACRNVAGATDFLGPRLVEQFGGVPRFEQSKTADYVPEERVGMYL